MVGCVIGPVVVTRVRSLEGEVGIGNLLQFLEVVPDFVDQQGIFLPVFAFWIVLFLESLEEGAWRFQHLKLNFWSLILVYTCRRGPVSRAGLIFL